MLLHYVAKHKNAKNVFKCCIDVFKTHMACDWPEIGDIHGLRVLYVQAECWNEAVVTVLQVDA